MIHDGVVVETEVDRRNLYLLAAEDVIPIAFRKSPIKSSFKRAGIYPPTLEPILNNPCVTNMEQKQYLERQKLPNVDITKNALVNYDDIPKRRAETLLARAKKSVETRRKHKENERGPTIKDLFDTIQEDESDSYFQPADNCDDENDVFDENQFTNSEINEDQEYFREENGNFDDHVIENPQDHHNIIQENRQDFQKIPTINDISTQTQNIGNENVGKYPASEKGKTTIDGENKKRKKEYTFADTDLFKQLRQEKHKEFSCQECPTKKRQPKVNKNDKFIY